MRRNIINLVIVALFSITAGSCASQGRNDSDELTLVTSGHNTITVTKDIPCREGNSNSWKLDLAMPANFGPEIRPALVIVHGGGWAAGSKSVNVYQKMMVDYAHKGYVTINVAAAGSPPTELGRDVPMADPVWWPIGYISADHPPMLLIPGTEDPVVLPARTRDFVEKMKAAGAANIEYLELEGGHGVAYDQKLDVTDPAIENFLAKYLKPAL